jgi:hypothetical protein
MILLVLPVFIYNFFLLSNEYIKYNRYSYSLLQSDYIILDLFPVLYDYDSIQMEQFISDTKCILLI